VAHMRDLVMHATLEFYNIDIEMAIRS
jgi:hypothetical protein